jgi:hypothetical protein
LVKLDVVQQLNGIDLDGTIERPLSTGRRRPQSKSGLPARTDIVGYPGQIRKVPPSDSCTAAAPVGDEPSRSIHDLSQDEFR